MNKIDHAKPGDVFAVPYSNHPAPGRVVAARVTRAQIIDTDGGRWNRSNGRRVGSETGKIVPWTAEHDAMIENYELDKSYRAAMERLGASRVERGLISTAAQRAALPHLLAAVAAMEAA